MESRPLFNYSQRILIDKVNRYQQTRNGALLSPAGCCFGFALIWGLTMSKQQAHLFYREIKFLVDKSFAEYNEARIKKFLAIIDRHQNSAIYDAGATHFHLTKITKIANIESLSFKNNFYNLCARMKPKKDPALYIIHTVEHAVAAFHYAGFYHVYDANYETGEAKVFAHETDATQEILLRLIKKTVAMDELIELTFNYIPMEGILKHNVDEIVIDIPVDEKGYEADNEEEHESSSRRRSSSCAIL